MLVGHIGIALLQQRFLDAELVPVMAGGLFPDILDKTLCQVLQRTPSGRMWGHTALSVVTSTVLVRMFAGRRPARDWLLGYIGHLLADSGGPIPWWYPFKTYTFKRSPGLMEIVRRFTEDQVNVLLEFALLALGLFALTPRDS